MSTISSHVRPSVAMANSSHQDVPPLENGDTLSRDEFERRYETMPGVKAELIEGVVYMASPVRMQSHGSPHVFLGTWLGVYHASTPHALPADNATARLDLDNEPQPDLLLMIDPIAGGQAKIDADDYVEGAPELTVEVSSSTASIDLNSKFNVYRRAGVREYLVWRTREHAIDWFERRGSDFVAKMSADDGVMRSVVFPGLWLDATALLAGDLAKVIATLQQGLATPEHAAFVAQLAAKKPTP